MAGVVKKRSNSEKGGCFLGQGRLVRWKPIQSYAIKVILPFIHVPSFAPPYLGLLTHDPTSTYLTFVSTVEYGVAKNDYEHTIRDWSNVGLEVQPGSDQMWKERSQETLQTSLGNVINEEYWPNRAPKRTVRGRFRRNRPWNTPLKTGTRSESRTSQPGLRRILTTQHESYI